MNALDDVCGIPALDTIALDPSMDWKQAENWVATHPVGRVFAEISADVLYAKEQGACVPARVIGTDEATFLAAARDRLERTLGFSTRLEDLEPGVEGIQPEEVQRWMRLMGVDRSRDADRWRTEGRDYLLSQHAAMTVTSWKDPAQAILFCAAQMAVHDVVDLDHGNEEPQRTNALIASLSAVIRHRFIPPMRHPGPSLPPDTFLSVTAASMTNVKDRMGADLAIAIGSLIDDKPRYRVAIFQAKVEDRERKRMAAVFPDKPRLQLRKLLRSGMGYYLFYPRIGEGGSAPMTVRPAIDVARELRLGRRGYRNHVGTCAGAPRTWDFATFLAVGMIGDQEKPIGRVFENMDEVAHILSSERKVPVAARLLAIDTTRRLRAHALVEMASRIGYEETSSFEVPSGTTRPQEDERYDDEAPSPTWGR